MPDDDYGFEFSDEEEEVRQLTSARAHQRRSASATSTLPAQPRTRADPPAQAADEAVQIENAYYAAKGACRRVAQHTKGLSPEKQPLGLLESDDPREALAGFASVIELEKEQGEWCVLATL